jgi:hypothetical protein
MSGEPAESDLSRQARIVREALLKIAEEDKSPSAHNLASFASDETLAKLGRLLKA